MGTCLVRPAGSAVPPGRTCSLQTVWALPGGVPRRAVGLCIPGQGCPVFFRQAHGSAGPWGAWRRQRDEAIFRCDSVPIPHQATCAQRQSDHHELTSRREATPRNRPASDVQMKRGNRLTWAIWTFLEMCSETYSPSEATHELRQPAGRTALTQARPEEALGRSPPSSLGAHVHAGPFAVFPLPAGTPQFWKCKLCISPHP